MQIKDNETEENRGTDEGMHQGSAPSHIIIIIAICRSATAAMSDAVTFRFHIVIILFGSMSNRRSNSELWRRKPCGKMEVSNSRLQHGEYPCHSSGSI